MRRFCVALAATALLFSACATDDDPVTAASEEPAAVQPQTISFTATDYALAGPSKAEAGAAVVSVKNDGKELHQAILFKLNAGVDVAKLRAAGKVPGGILAVGTYDAGGPSAAPGGSDSTTVDLTPGKYVFMCEIPDGKGVPHVALGMVTPFEVTAATGEEAEPPAADAEASGTEFKFELPDEWDGTVEFTNAGSQGHEIAIIGVAPGKTPEQAQKGVESDALSGPPPFTLAGGTGPVAPGKKIWFDANLEPGTYFAYCFVADPAKRAPHFALGMKQRFEVT